jgi:hypothetical protein
MQRANDQSLTEEAQDFPQKVPFRKYLIRRDEDGDKAGDGNEHEAQGCQSKHLARESPQARDTPRLRHTNWRTTGDGSGLTRVNGCTAPPVALNGCERQATVNAGSILMPANFNRFRRGRSRLVRDTQRGGFFRSAQVRSGSCFLGMPDQRRVKERGKIRDGHELATRICLKIDARIVGQVAPPAVRSSGGGYPKRACHSPKDVLRLQLEATGISGDRR